MAYVAMAYIAVVYIVMACIAMAYNSHGLVQTVLTHTSTVYTRDTRRLRKLNPDLKKKGRVLLTLSTPLRLARWTRSQYHPSEPSRRPCANLRRPRQTSAPRWCRCGGIGYLQTAENSRDMKTATWDAQNGDFAEGDFDEGDFAEHRLCRGRLCRGRL